MAQARTFIPYFIVIFLFMFDSCFGLFVWRGEYYYRIKFKASLLVCHLIIIIIIMMVLYFHYFPIQKEKESAKNAYWNIRERQPMKLGLRIVRLISMRVVSKWEINRNLSELRYLSTSGPKLIHLTDVAGVMQDTVSGLLYLAFTRGDDGEKHRRKHFCYSSC